MYLYPVKSLCEIWKSFYNSFNFILKLNEKKKQFIRPSTKAWVPVSLKENRQYKGLEINNSGGLSENNQDPAVVVPKEYKSSSLEVEVGTLADPW